MTQGSNSRQRRPNWPALAVAAVFMALAGLVLWDTSHFAGMSSYSRVGPTAVPTVIAIGLAFISLGLGATALRETAPAAYDIEWAPVLWIVAGLLAQILLLNRIGFSLATGFVFACGAKGMGRGPLWLTYLLGVAISFALYLLFAKGLQLSLPGGFLEALV